MPSAKTPRKSKTKSIYLLIQHNPHLLNVQDDERDKGKLKYRYLLGEYDAKNMNSNANVNDYGADTNCRQIYGLGHL